MAFVRIAKVTDLQPGTIHEFEVDGTAVALANVAGKIHAINNTCLHEGGPLGEGYLEGAVVTCPWHGWQFSVIDGKDVQDPSVGVACYPTELRGDEIFVDIAPKA
jgi:nitrite reductase (NADH) small subunit